MAGRLIAKHCGGERTKYRYRILEVTQVPRTRGSEGQIPATPNPDVGSQGPKCLDIRCMPHAIVLSVLTAFRGTSQN